MRKILLQKNRAFTLVETLVSISILMLAILGPLSIASSGLKNAFFARDQITAYYLAQEGIEFVRYVRDENYTNYSNGTDNGWTYRLSNCMSPNYCSLDMPVFFGLYGSPTGSNYVPTSCNTSLCSTYLKKDSGGYYTYSGSAPGPTTTTFQRSLKITPNATNPNEIKVDSTVSWKTGSQAVKTFTISEDIFNFY